MTDRLASSLATLRADNAYSPRVNLSIYAPEPLVVADVDVILPEPVKAVVVTVTSGDFNDVRAGMRVAFYDGTSGVYKGSTRVRYGNTLSPGALHIRETMLSQINIQVGDEARIYPFFPLDTKLVAADQTFSPDGTPVSTNNSAPYPLVCSGGHSARWVDGYYSASPSTFATVATDGSGTITVDPASNSGVTDDWSALVTVGAAFQTGSASSDTSPVFELDAGLHLIEHTAEDNDNSAIGSQYTVHMVHDDDNLPYDVLLTTPPEGDENGWAWTVQLFDELDLDACPDGALCILWADYWLNGTYTHQTLGIGYARRDTSTGDGDDGESLTLEIQSPLARLAEICSYSKVMEENGTPDDWGEIKTLGVQRAIIQDWMFYTTGTEAGYDLRIHSLFSDARYPVFYLNRSDAVTQLRELADGRRGRLVQRGRGAIFEVQPRLDLLEWSERAGLTTTITLTDDDVLSYEYAREHFDNTEMLEVRGISAGTSGNTDLYSRSPVGGGSQAQTQERCIPDSQTALNIECGLRWAALENLFYDPDNEYRMHRVGELTLRIPGVYSFWDFECEYIRFQYAGSLRGIDFADTRFWLKRVTTEVDADTGEWITALVLQAETYALPGATFVYPVQPTTDYTPSAYVPLPYTPPTVGGSRLPLWNGVDLTPTKMFLLASSHAKAYIVTAWNPVSGVLSETEISTGLSGTGIWATSDPYDYRRRFALTTNGLYRCDDIWAASPSWTQVASNAAMFNGDSSGIGTAVWMSINRRGWILVTSGFSNAITFNYGASWTFTDIAGSPGTAATALSKDTMQVAVSARNSGSQGWLYAAAGNGTGGNDSILKSTDWGLTWATVDADIGSAFDVTPRIDIPYVRIDGTTPNTNDASQELWLTYGAGHSGNAGELWLSQNGGASWTTKISHSGSGIPVPAGSICGTPIRTFTFNGARVQVATLQTGAGGDQGGFLITNDAGATETYRASIGGTGSNFEAFINGYPEHSMATLYWDRNGVVKWTLDDGLTVVLATNPSGITGWAYAEWDLSERVAPG